MALLIRIVQKGCEFMSFGHQQTDRRVTGLPNLYEVVAVGVASGAI